MPVSQLTDRSKDEKLKLQAPLLSEKINYTTAKFFEQAPDTDAEHTGNIHSRAHSYRTANANIGHILSDHSILNQTSPSQTGQVRYIVNP